MNHGLKGKKATYEKDFECFLKPVIGRHLSKKSLSESRDEEIVSTPMVSKIQRNKAKRNYHLGTIAKVIGYLESKGQKKGTKRGR